MKLKIKTTIEINVPSGTKIVRQDSWLTLFRKSNGICKLFTCPIEDASVTDFFDEDVWTDFDQSEILKIYDLL